MFLIFLVCIVVPLMFISTKAQNLKDHMNLNSAESLVKPAIIWNISQSETYQESESDLRIFPDGKVLVGRRFCEGNITETSISSTELQQILKFATEDHDFFAIKAEEIKNDIKEIEEQRRLTSVDSDTIRVDSERTYLDTGVSVIQITTDGRSKTVKYHALFAAARDFPEVLPLQQLREIEVKLAQVAVNLSQKLCMDKKRKL